MTTYQTLSNAYRAFKVQSALGSQASGSGGTVFRTTGGADGQMNKAATESDEVRRDGMRTRGRHGTQKTGGNPSGHLSLGTYDEIFEAVMRGTYGTADLQLDESDFTSITTGANSIILASGSPIDLGLHVHDVIRLTNHASAGNNNRNLRITGLSATTITVAEDLTVNAVADTDCEITRPGRMLINPAAGSLVKRYFTWEEHEIDIDGSELFTDVVFGGMRFSMQPNGIIMFDTTWMGTGQFEPLTGGSAPHFTDPYESVSGNMAVVDATIRLGSEDLVALSSLDLSMDLQPAADDVFGSGAIKYSPDVFLGQLGIAMNLTMLRKDLAYVANHLAEDQLSLHILAVEQESEPKDFISIAIPNFTLGGVAKSALSKQGGGRTQTLSVPMALVGKDERGSGYNPTMAIIQISNAETPS